MLSAENRKDSPHYVRIGFCVDQQRCRRISCNAPCGRAPSRQYAADVVSDTPKLAEDIGALPGGKASAGESQNQTADAACVICECGKLFRNLSELIFVTRCNDSA